ncbi:hypothetical protein NDA14_001772 [Ustilago hordei]|nr:hypothetical protein NDA14_001772 [Ustilago hordei]
MGSDRLLEKSCLKKANGAALSPSSFTTTTTTTTTTTGPEMRTKAEPLFKKRGRCKPTRISASTCHATLADTNEDCDERLSVQELAALRALTRKPAGIQLDRLNNGERKPNVSRHKAASQTQMQMQRRDWMADAFQHETGTVDVDGHMMAYIEQELRQRTNASAPQPHDSSSSSSSSSCSASTQQPLAPPPKQEETNALLSTAMLTRIPEVDLGIQAKLDNIADTELAKRSQPLHSTKHCATDQCLLDRFKKRQRRHG